ncbi:MAG: hypothetical protein WAW13_02210 [Minisyncoccia bacterium]
MYTKIEDVVTDTDKFIEPVRRSLFRRFPVVLTLLVTFGVAATFFGIERVISEITWLNERPVSILLMGLVTLIFTGKLYQKLG